MKLGRIKIDSKYLPSRKFTIGLSVIVAIILVIVAFSFRGTRSYEATNNSGDLVAASSTSFEAFKELDSDHDGLPDWQEALYGTNPKKADTDGDGTPDGEEIKENRDPLKANTAPKGQTPNDTISPEVIAQDKKTIDEYNSLNVTDKFARDMFSQYIATKQDGSNSTLSETDKQLIALNSMPDIQVKKYTESDITIYSATNTQVEIKKYIDHVGFVLIETPIKEKIKSGTEGLIIEKVMDSSNGDSLKNLTPIMNLYGTELALLLKLPVPEEAVSVHLNLINTIGSKIAGLAGMKEMFTDPLKAVMLLKSYQDGTDNLYSAVFNIIDLANQQRITFAQNEYGYYLINMLKSQ